MTTKQTYLIHFMLVIRRTCDGAIFQTDQVADTFAEALTQAAVSIDGGIDGFTQDAYSVVAAWAEPAPFQVDPLTVPADAAMLPYATRYVP